MKILVLAALAALATLAVPSQVQAQVDQAHARAWAAFERGGKVTQRVRSTRTSVRRTGKRLVRRSTPAARYSPSIARDPVINNPVTQAVTSFATQMLPHPAGCPRVLFCACGAAVKLFGTADPKWWHTSTWRKKFPKAAPAPGMVAVNSRHIFVIDKVLPNGKVMAYDYNSGGGRSRYHMRSLSGYEVRNPRA